MACADDITITSTHNHECSQEIYTTIPTSSFCQDKTKQTHTKSRLTTCTLFTPDPAENKNNLDLQINNTTPHLKVLGLTLDPKLTYSTHIHTISAQAHKPLQLIKALTGWGKQKETQKGRYKTGSEVCLFHMVASCILDQH